MNAMITTKFNNKNTVHNYNNIIMFLQCYQAKGEKVEIHIFVQVNGILIAEMLMHY